MCPQCISVVILEMSTVSVHYLLYDIFKLYLNYMYLSHSFLTSLEWQGLAYNLTRKVELINQWQKDSVIGSPDGVLGKAATCADFILISTQCHLLWTNMEDFSLVRVPKGFLKPLVGVTLPRENTDLSLYQKPTYRAEGCIWRCSILFATTQLPNELFCTNLL